MLKVERKISVITRSDDTRGIDQTKHLTPEERLSLLEDLRREMAKIQQYDYPQRLRRVLEVVKRDGG
jgi:nicotinamide riboside kinase